MVFWTLLRVFLFFLTLFGQDHPFEQDPISNPLLSVNARHLKLSFPVSDGDVDWALNKTHKQYSKRRIIPQSRFDEPDPDDIPVNFVFHNFPNIAFENAAKHGLIDALRLANAALAATDELTTSYDRYFQRDELDTVRQIYEAIITESVYVQCSDSHEINIWFEDSVGNFDGCAQGLAAYHLTPGSGVIGLNIILCTELFHLYPNPLETITRDDLKSYADESMETVGLTLLHELTHLSTVVGGLVISDVHIQSDMDVSPSNPLGYVKAYGPYLAMLANKDEHAGSLNADNFAFFAAESFFLQEHEIEGFSDPPPSQSSNFHPARSVKISVGDFLPESKVTTSNLSMLPLKNVTGVVIPPFKVPGPGFPQNWIFHDFPSEDHNLLDLSIEGLVDAWRLADVAAQSLLGSFTTSFYRYFQEEDACDVEDVFNLVLKQANLPQDPMYRQRDWKIHYDDTNMPDRLCPRRGDYAYFVESLNYELPAIIVCPLQFEINTRLLDTVSCNEIEAHASEDTMDNIGATLLHKMLHDYGMTGDANVFASDVEFEAPLVNSDGTVTKRFVKGYGPYWSHYINVNQHAGTDNVDNFVWYALETWFSQMCGTNFGDPAPTPADISTHARRSLKGIGPLQLLGRRIDHNATNFARQAGDPSPRLPINSQHLPGLPQNIFFAEFPPQPEYLFAVGASLASAYNLAVSALQAIDEGSKHSNVMANGQRTTTTYLRYFRQDQLCTVRKVFDAILSVMELTPRTRPEASRPYTFWFTDNNFYNPQCPIDPSLSAYALHQPPDIDATGGLKLILCPKLIQRMGLRIQDFDCAMLGGRPMAIEWGAPAITVLHELMHDYELTSGAAGLQISDMTYYDVTEYDFRGNGHRSPIQAYGPYWSQWANKNRGDGIRNADNYVFFAWEAFLADKCRIGLNGFLDADWTPVLPLR